MTKTKQPFSCHGRLAIFLFAAGIAILSGRDADAQPGKAEAAFTRGVQFFDARHYRDAADAFAEAYEADHQEKYLWNLAVAELRAERFVSALHHLREYKASPNALRAHLELIDEIIARADRNVGHIVVSAPPGLTVTIDGSLVGTAPLSGPVDVAANVSHEVRAEGDGRHLGGEVVVPAGVVTPVHLEESHAASVPAAPAPKDALRTNEPSPVEGHEMARPSMTTRNVVVVSLAALAVGAAITGTVFQVMVGNDQSAHDHYVSALAADAMATGYPQQNVCALAPMLSDCTNLQAANNKRENDGNLATGFFVAAGGTAAAGILTFFLWPRPHPAHPALLLPEFGPGRGGATLVGSF
jgi:hypothetical protein